MGITTTMTAALRSGVVTVMRTMIHNGMGRSIPEYGYVPSVARIISLVLMKFAHQVHTVTTTQDRI
jgi:hypothetical protein